MSSHSSLLSHQSCSRTQVEGTLVKALFHCKLENLKKLIEPLLFAEYTMITGQGFFHIIGLVIIQLAGIDICVTLVNNRISKKHFVFVHFSDLYYYQKHEIFP